MPPKRVQAKNWFVTENNPSEETIQRYKELECEWLCLCKEHQDQDNATPHIHAAICFKGKRDFKALKKLFPRADWEVMRGSPQDSKTYMTKEDTNPFEKGQMPVDGRKKGGSTSKKKWEDAYQLALEGKFDDIPKDLYLRYDRAFHRVYEEHKSDPSMEEMGDDDLKDHFLWLWGPTGTGKSHTAREISKKLGCEDPFYKQINKWWNGYSRQTVTIIEEADPKRCEHLAGYFKQWCDKWPFSGEVKCGNFPSMRPQYIIVTSNYSITDCFPEEQDYVPLKRRFTEHELTRRGEPFSWPLIPPRPIDGMDQDRALPGNTEPGGLEPPAPGIEPEAKRRRVIDESGLIEQPPILEDTPEDFNSDEINE